MSYYLYTTQRLEIGETIKPINRETYWLGSRVEQLFEKGRPSHCLARPASILLYDNSDAKPEKYCYEVAPIGALEKGNTGWLTMVTKYQDADWIAL